MNGAEKRQPGRAPLTASGSLKSSVGAGKLANLGLLAVAVLAATTGGCPTEELPTLTVTIVTPDHGPTSGGTEVTVRGVLFEDNVGVLFGAKSATRVVVVNGSLMRATTPSNAEGEAAITFVDATGNEIATGAVFTYEAPEPDDQAGQTDVPIEPDEVPAPEPPALVVDSIVPAIGTLEGGTLVTIHGQGFAEGTTVVFDDLSALQVTYGNAEMLTAMAPAHAAGTVDLTVTTPDLRSVTLVDAFEYLEDTDGDGVADLDTDGDGLTDRQETEGWMIWVDFFGLGQGADPIGQYTVTSNPETRQYVQDDGDSAACARRRGDVGAGRGNAGAPGVDGLLVRDVLDPNACAADPNSVWHDPWGWGCVCGDESTDDCSPYDNEEDCVAHGGVWTPFGTDPTLADTDHDGLTDDIDGAPLVPAPTLHVDPTASPPDDPNDPNAPLIGLSWTTAYATLAEAIENAWTRNSNGDAADDVAEIWVATGTYQLEHLQNLPSNLGLYGGFTGTEDKRGQRNVDPATNGVQIVPADNGPQHAFVIDTKQGVVLDGFAISDFGTTTSSPSGDVVRIAGVANVTLRNLLLVNNEMDFLGAVGIQGAGPSAKCEVTIASCVFAGNAADAGGAGIYTIHGDLAIRNCVFSGNHASDQGGAVRALYSDLAVYATRFEGNAVITESEYALGGALSLLSGSATFTNCRFANNVTRQEDDPNTPGGGEATGGAVYTWEAYAITFTNCVFIGNQLHPDPGSNAGGTGYAIAAFNNVGDLSLVNCSIVGNWTEGGTGPSFAVDGSGEFMNVQNTVIASNGPDPNSPQRNIRFRQPLDPPPPTQPEDFYMSHTCLYPLSPHDLEGLATWHSPATMILDNPLFDTNWQATGIPSLQGSSPLIDAGLNWVDCDPTTPGVQFLPLTDYAGGLRIVDGNSDGVMSVDIGAFEVQGGGTP